MSSKKTVVSLFACSGFGDYGLRSAGYNTILMNELDPLRAELAKLNFPEAKVIVGDINEELANIVKSTKEKLGKNRLTLLIATPPCQGMSKNGIGTILKAMRDGKRPKIDSRNYLFQPTIEAIKLLNPKIHIFENVDRMMNTYIIINGESILVTEHITSEMKKIGYDGEFRMLNAADYGVPQFRKRTIGIFISRKDYPKINVSDLYPQISHGKLSRNTHPYVTLEEAIGSLPRLDSRDKSVAQSEFHYLHKVPVSRKDLYYWIENTPEGKSAFENNVCPKCKHVNASISILCAHCSTLLPKPVVIDKVTHNVRLIRGFTSAYKRMKLSAPSHTITTRSAYAGSDSNLHPTQNRVLSMYECCIIQGIKPENFKWGPIRDRSYANDMLIRDVIGEAVPAKLIEVIATHITSLLKI